MAGSRRVSDVDPRLAAHRPALVYDPQEAYPAASAGTITGFPGNVLRDRRRDVVARAGEGLSLELLGSYAATDADVLDEQPDPTAAARWFAGRQEGEPRVYGRVAADGGRTWLQYWIWGYYNPKNLLGFGGHEGDWEMVQVGLGSDGRPAVVTASQHDTGEARAWEHCEHLESDHGVHPVIYVAPLSHANYFEPGAHPYIFGIDNPDGTLAPLLPPVEPLGPWAEWPGRWGASRGLLGGRFGRSPASPAYQGIRWTAPATYHRLAEAVTPVRTLGRILHGLTSLTWPRLTRLEASAEPDGGIAVEWALDGSLLRSATRLHVTLHDGDGRLLADDVEPIHGRSGELRLPAPPDGGVPDFIRASAYNTVRQRSDPVQARVRT
jgi:hypothetical protein